MSTPYRRPIIISVVLLVAWTGLVAFRELNAEPTVVLTPGKDVPAALPTSPTPTGSRLPDISLQTFDGSPISTNAVIGQPTVINFWQESCTPCKEEMPAFERVHRARGEKIRMIGIDTQDSFERASTFVQKLGITYTLWRDQEGDLFKDLQLVAFPSTVFIDATGRVVGIKSGSLTEQQLLAKIDEYFPS
jgi:thiol-disulfide isomerase/thioredoxin